MEIDLIGSLKEKKYLETMISDLHLKESVINPNTDME